MLKGKVALIIDNRTLAINLGLKDGVQEGMKFRILSRKKEKIIDPDTNEVLGRLNISKYKVRVVRVEEKFSVAETYLHHTVNEGGAFPAFSKIFEPPKLVKKYETFDLSSASRSELSEADSAVKVGDIVEQILEQ